MRKYSLMRQLLGGETAVYAIVNEETGRQYIGSTVDFYERKLKHEAELRKGTHGNRELQADFIQYGERCFSFIVVKVCGNKQQAARMERAMIEAEPGSYNVQHNGERWKEMQSRRLLGNRNGLRKDHAAIERIVNEYMAGGISFTALAEKYKIPRSTIRNYTNRRAAGQGITG